MDLTNNASMLKITITDSSITWSLFGRSNIQSGSIPIRNKEALEKLTDEQILQLTTQRIYQYWNIQRYFHNYKIIKQ
jgi:hypothetical protein